MDLATLEQQLTTAIGQQETANATTGIGASLNNPGGLKYARWEGTYGATPGPNGFAQFDSVANGYAATKALISSYVSKGFSLTSLINAWSPASDGNANNQQRISQLANATGLDPSQPINSQAPIGNGDVLGQGVRDAQNPPVEPSTGKSLADSALSFSWGRIAAFLLGFVFIVLGLVFLKQTQIVVNTVGKNAAKVAALAA